MFGRGRLLMFRWARRTPRFPTRLRMTWFTWFIDTFAVIDDFGGWTIAGAFLGVGSETVYAGETAGVGGRGTFWCGGGFAVRGVGAFFLLLVGVDLWREGVGIE